MATGSKVLVSALVSVYNAPDFIEGCLTDLTEQTLFSQGKLEIVIVDSDSPGNEQQVIQKFANNYPNVINIKTDRRETLSAAWNRGILNSNGEYLTIANCDDRHRRDALEALSNRLEENPQVDLVFADAIESSVKNEKFAECRSSKFYVYPDYNYENCLHHHQFGHQPIWRRSLHNNIGMFAPHLRAVGDGDFNIRFNLHNRKALHVREKLGLFFQNPGSLTNDTSVQLDERRIMKAKYRNEANIIKLLRYDGAVFNNEADIANGLLRVGVTSLLFRTPWSADLKSDLEFSAFCFQSAIKYAPRSMAIRKNLEELLKVLRHEKALDISLFASQIESSLYPVAASAQTKKNFTIACLAGDENNFSFFTPIKQYLEEKNFTVNCYNSSELQNESFLTKLNESDLVWCEWANGPAIPISQLASKPPMVVRMHRYEAYEGTINQINWFGVDKLITINSEFIDVIKRYHEPEIDKNVSVIEIPNSVSSKLKFTKRSNNFRIAYISRFQKDKNPQLMLQILAGLVQKDPRYSVHMVGRIQDYQLYDYCMHLVNELGLQNNFFYEGIVGDIEPWLEDKSIILSTSIVESQGLGLMEAMMMGIKPVIHNSFGNLDDIYGKDLTFNTAAEAIELITFPRYDSENYRDLILGNYGDLKILPQIEVLITRLITPEKVNLADGATENLMKQQTAKLPFVSICIPVYNRADYISEAIESALNQTYENFEIVIVDDGSTDGTRNILNRYAANKRVKIIYKEHTNAPDTRNRAIAEASGDYILWLDSDDVLRPHLLSTYGNVLRNYPDTDALYCNLVSIGEETNVVHEYQNWQNRQDDAIRYLLHGSPIPNPGLLIKRSLLSSYLYDVSFRRAHDYELWSRILFSTSLAVKYVPEVLVNYRIHADNLSGRMKPHIDLSFDSKIIQNVLNKKPLSFFFPHFNWQQEEEKATDTACLHIAMKFLQLNDITCALQYISKIHDPEYRQKFEPILRKYQIEV